MVMSAEQRSKFAALHRSWWPLCMIEKFSNATEKQTKTLKNNNNIVNLFLFPIDIIHYIQNYTKIMHSVGDIVK